MPRLSESANVSQIANLKYWHYIVRVLSWGKNRLIFADHNIAVIYIEVY